MKRIRVYEELVPTIIEAGKDFGEPVEVSEDFYEKWRYAQEVAEQFERDLRAVMEGKKCL